MILFIKVSGSEVNSNVLHTNTENIRSPTLNQIMILSILSTMHTQPWIPGPRMPATIPTKPGHQLPWAAGSAKPWPFFSLLLLWCVYTYIWPGGFVCWSVRSEMEISIEPPQRCHSPLQSGQLSPQRSVQEQAMRHLEVYLKVTWFCLVEESMTFNSWNQTCILCVFTWKGINSATSSQQQLKVNVAFISFCHTYCIYFEDLIPTPLALVYSFLRISYTKFAFDVWLFHLYIFHTQCIIDSTLFFLLL